MRNTNKRMGSRLWMLSMILTLILSACGSSNADATPTLSVDAIFTSAHQTIAAEQATQLALTPPTATASVTPFPTLPPPSPFPTVGVPLPTVPGLGGGACDNSAYVADVTIPDGTTMTPGQKFEKKWKLLNSGSCAWSTSYKLAFDSGEQMGGTASSVPVPVPSGNQTDIAVNLVAPTAAGTYTGKWRMQNDKSLPFGNIITVVIKVGSGGPSATAGTPPTAGPSPTASITNTPGGDVTISGNAGAVDVLITWEGKGSADGTFLAVDGKYSITVPSGWDGTVTPSKGIYTFSPANRTYTNVTTNQTGQDFVATPG